MKSLPIVALLGLALAGAAPVAAQAAPQAEAKPATAAEIAEARSRADAIIAAAEAGEFFENITTTAAPAVRHKASGMTCSFGDDPRDSVHIYPTGPGRVPRGEDVSCSVRMMEAEHTTYATRYPDGHSARDDLGIAVAAVRQRWPDAHAHEGPIPVATRQGGPEVLAAAYDIKLNDRPMLTLILTAKAGDWNFKHRATGPAEDTTLPLAAGLSFVLSLPGGRD